MICTRWLFAVWICLSSFSSCPFAHFLKPFSCLFSVSNRPLIITKKAITDKSTKKPTVGTAQKAVAKKHLCVFSIKSRSPLLSANSSFQLALQLRIKLLLGQDLLSSRTLRLFLRRGAVAAIAAWKSESSLLYANLFQFETQNTHRILKVLTIWLETFLISACIVLWWQSRGKGKDKRSIAVRNTPHRYGNSHAIWDHTVLPATWQR